MVHFSLHWTKRGVNDLSLWSFAVKHSVWLYNRLPNRESGITPLEHLTRARSDHRDILCAHVWGCPVFVLEPKLQNDQKLPKWNRRSRMGQFLGFSDEHSSLVANVRNLSTGYISPQCHLVFDDLFETDVCKGDNDNVVDGICNDLFECSRDWYAEEEYDDVGKLIYRPPPLDDVWLDERGRRERKAELEHQRRRNDDCLRERNRSIPDIIPLGAKDDDRVPEGAHISDDEESVDSSVGPLSESEGEIFERDGSPQRDDDVARTPPPPPLNSAPEGATAPQPHPPEQASEGAGPRTSRRRPKKWPSPAWERDKDSGKLRRLELNKLNRELFALTCGPQNPPPKAKKLSKKRKRLNYKQYKLLLRDQGDTSLNKMRVEESCPTIAELLASPLAEFITRAANDCG